VLGSFEDEHARVLIADTAEPVDDFLHTVRRNNLVLANDCPLNAKLVSYL
jgi:hypothetical protein